MDNPFKDDLMGAVTLVDEMLHIRKDRMQVMECLAMSEIIRQLLRRLPESESKIIRAEIEKMKHDRDSPPSPIGEIQ